MAAAVVLFILGGMLAALVLTRISPEAVFIAGLTAVTVFPVYENGVWRAGVIDLGEAVRGFSNPGMLTVAALFLVVAGLRETGAMDWVAQRMLGLPKTHRGALTRMMGPTLGLSVFLNNTPVVAMLIPVIADWSRKLRLQPSQLLIPLSYASILGGTCSLIGTSTNLVVAGLVSMQTDLRPLQMFDITWLGVPCVVVGGLYLLLVGPRLLPKRTSSLESLSDPREYTVEMLVQPTSPLVGRTIEEAGLRHLERTYLAEIDRGGQTIVAVGPEERLQAGDRLLFVGVVDAVRDLQNIRGLVPATDQVFKLDSPRYRRRLFEAVVSDTSPIAGRTIRAGQFRTRYRAAVLAVARNGERVKAKLGDIELQPGDTLLLEADPNFGGRYRNSRDFFLVSMLEDSAPRRHERAWVALSIMLGMIVLATIGWLSMLQAAAVAACLMVLTRCCTIAEARQSVNGPVLVVIACALGFERALDGSGAASLVAAQMLALAGDRPWLMLLAVYILTSLITEVITNNAAVALVFPVAFATTHEMGINFMPFVMAIMMAGSASFATPIGYQTNLMVYGPGGYRFTDFLRVGLPMNVLMAATVVLLAPLIWPF